MLGNLLSCRASINLSCTVYQVCFDWEATTVHPLVVVAYFGFALVYR